MKKSIVCITALLSAVMVPSAYAREVRTPLPGMQGRFPQRYPLEYHTLCGEKENDDECSWLDSIDMRFFAQGYHRAADRAYGCDTTSDACDPWSTLIFGKSDFRLGETAPDGILDSPELRNPLASVSVVKPRFEYAENGALFGMQLETDFTFCDATYRVGMRARLPYRDIEVSDPCGTSDLVGEQLDDVYVKREETIDGVTNEVFAARFDFLNSLNDVALPADSLVTYSTTAPTLKIADVNVGAAVGNNAPVVGAIRSTDGSVPAGERFGKKTTPGDFDGTVQGNGSGGGDKARLRFEGTTDYSQLEQDRDAQQELFVVPSMNDNQQNNPGMTAGAQKIRNQIDAAVAGINDSIKDYLEEIGVDFCDGRTKGLGDLDLEWYIGRNWHCCYDFYTDARFGVRVPTADELCDCKKPLQQPLGNNDHTELRVGADVGMDMYSWLKFSADASYNWALDETEQVAVPYKGAKIKNLSDLCMQADIDYEYFLGHFDVTFVANECCGMDLGYELYHKRCDDISLCKRPNELASSTELSSAVLREKSERTAHKVRAGMFAAIGECEIFGGWSHVFAGKNAPRETDWYLSMMVNF